MTFDFTITFGNLITLAVIVFGMIAAWFQLSGQIAAAASKAKEGFDIARQARDSLTAHKLEVLRDHVTVEQFAKAEQRWTEAIRDVVEEVRGLRRDITDKMMAQPPSRRRGAE